MSFRIKKTLCCSKDMKKTTSVSSLHESVGERVIKNFPLPYNFGCTPNQERDFSEELHAACKYNHETRYMMLRLTKVIVVGDVAVGKTCLVKRFCLQPFDKNSKATMGVDFESKKCYILNIPYILQMWDTSGQEKYNCIAPLYYRGAKVVVLVFDFYHLSSLYKIQKWLERTLECCDNPLLFLVGTKKDKIAKSAFKLAEQEAIKVANEIGAEYWPVSSKTGDNIEALVSRIAVISFCEIKESENAQEVKVSNDFVKISKTNMKKKDKKCVQCS